MEIERKFAVKRFPEGLENYPYTEMEQAYLSVDPIVRVRQDGDAFYLTYKGPGMLSREEYNLPLNESSYRHLKEKRDGRVVKKRRYRIPFGPYTIELDVFHGAHEGLVMAEVEFPTVEEALAFTPPDWFGEEVTYDRRYHNSYLALNGFSC